MKKFFFFSLAYFLFAMTILFIFRENPTYQVWDAGRRTAKTLIAFVKYLPYILGLFIVLYVTGRRYMGKKTMAEVSYAFAGCLVFSSSFTFMKTSMPFIIPFYADPFFADLDKALHGGVDPWVWTHGFASYLNADMVSTLYFAIWGLPAAFFPLLLALTDGDAERKARFMLLFCFVWIGLGNIVAYSGSSVGPIYYDRLLGGDRFAGLIDALQVSGVTDSHLGLVQFGLWKVFTEHSQMVGSGISAFPSVHNGVATLAMLYLCERSKWLAPIGVAFCAAILFASVYVGWHYAIDGYASIVLVVAAWAVLRKLQVTAPSFGLRKTGATTTNGEGALA